MTLIRPLALALAAVIAAGSAIAAPPVTHETDGDLEDIVLSVQDAIVNAGLVIDGQNHVGDMLARTKEDVGGTKDLFSGAEVFTFCSASVSRAVMERDIANIQFCPYSIFIYEAADKPGKIIVGHRDYAADGLPEVNALIDPIVESALQ